MFENNVHFQFQQMANCKMMNYIIIISHFFFLKIDGRNFLKGAFQLCRFIFE